MYSLTVAASAVAMLLSSSPARASSADDRIESSFKTSYVNQTYLKDDSVKASAKDGVVTLTGTVAGEANKSLAQDTAESLAGVTRVDNLLQTKEDVVTDKADTWIGRKVKLALLFHRNVNSSKTGIDVRDGVVTLNGVASSAAQKDLTTEYANDIDGVKSVNNQMVVSTTPKSGERSSSVKMDDASITAQVRYALMSHRSTNSVKTRVETRNGEVKLTGIAKNAAEKALVTKLVNDIQGVTSVKNQMTIEVAQTQ
jgi:osmotically-inducible protein OsmY